MLLMIPLSLDEVVAMVQRVARKTREGHSAWRVFWLGAHLPEDAPARQPVREEKGHALGAWGVLSRDLLTRAMIFEAALVAAFAPFYNAELFGGSDRRLA